MAIHKHARKRCPTAKKLRGLMLSGCRLCHVGVYGRFHFQEPAD